MARRLLLEKALFNFEASIAKNSYTETVDNLELVLTDVAQEIFLERAVQQQRHALWRNLQKPADMLTAVFNNCLNKMSNDLIQYPDGKPSNALKEDKREEILEYSLPSIWRTHMKLLMWECTGKSQAKIVAFCKKLEEY